MRRCDLIAIIICLGIFVAGINVSNRIYENIPHIEDEMAFVWQARVIARGYLWLPTPQPNPDSFKVPFVVDYQGKRFGKYPPGWPALLAVAELFPIRALINPFLTALGFWWLYRLASRQIDPPTALLAITLGAVSPFVWMNSGTLLSHPWSLLLTVVFVTAWLDAFHQANPRLPASLRRWIPTLAAALALGALALTRPWTAVAVALPFGFHGAYLLLRSDHSTRLRLGAFMLLSAGISALYLVWQAAVTGSLFTNPYTLWWPYDRIGFGPGVGRQPGGYQLADARANTLFSLFVANSDLFGWPLISWLFIPFGLMAIRRKPQVWLVSALLPALVGAYALYWTPSWVYGPRYYYEAIPAALVLSAAGIRWLAGILGSQMPARQPRWPGTVRFVLTNFLVCLLIMLNLVYYLPARLNGLSGLYGIHRECASALRIFSTSQEQPLLVFIELQKDFHEYSCSLDITSPFLDSHLITAVSRGEMIDGWIVQAFPGRNAFNYNPVTRHFSHPYSDQAPALPEFQ